MNILSLTRNQIISEANNAFNLNMKIFQALNCNNIKIMLLLFSINNCFNQLA
uniref:Uncharacterized protein n=1 Tax=Polysiphonia infestans TaxID=2006978 RepID=A0A1Z1MEC5_9FLOR|nr:hypothetical protein [Polysiphonia infestans]ARW64380.1 hypothetical protein [Polysiphonia infestans]